MILYDHFLSENETLIWVTKCHHLSSRKQSLLQLCIPHEGTEGKSIAAVNFWLYPQDRYFHNTEEVLIEEMLADANLCQCKTSLFASPILGQQFSKYDPGTLPRSLRDNFRGSMRSNDSHNITWTSFAFFIPLSQSEQLIQNLIGARYLSYIFKVLAR